MESFDATLKGLQKKFGKKITLASEVPLLGRLSTGSLSLDLELGGWNRGKITTLCGRNSVTKTATAFHAIAEAQRAYPELHAGIVSMEPFDREWARTNGVDLSRLYVAEPEVGEEALDTYEAFLDTRQMSILVMDSLGALVPNRELTESSEDGMMGLRAKLIKRLMMKTNARLQPTGDGIYNPTVCLMLNHIYDSMEKYVPYTIAGGKSVMMFSSTIVTFSKGANIWEGAEKASEVIGLEVNVKIEKDKTQKPKQPFGFRFYNGNAWEGKAVAGNYDNIQAIIDYATVTPTPADALIKKKGAWYYLPDVDSPVQGDVKVWEYLHENPNIAVQMERKLRENYSGQVFE